MNTRTINILLMVSIICLSLSAIFVRFSDAPATILVMYRMLLACVIISPIVWKYKAVIRQLTRNEWLAILFAGLFLASHFSLWFESLNHTTVASSTLILALQPGVALLFGILLFKERTTMTTVIALAIAFSGVVIVGGGSVQANTSALYGNFLSFASVICVVIYLMIGQRNIKGINHWVYSFLVFFVAGLAMLLFNVASSTALLGYSQQDWLVFVLLALFPTTAHIIFNLLLNYVNPTTVSMSTLGEPIGASILAFFILHERLSVTEMIGGVIILCGIYLFLRVQSRPTTIAVNAVQKE